MDDCIEAQWELYIGYMRESLDYTIIIMPLTIIPITFQSLVMQITAYSLWVKIVYVG
jgi:hypothetical protein